MPSTGPLAKVNTALRSVNLDLSRILNWGKGLYLEFIVVDRSQIDGWRTVLVLTKGFNRIVHSESTDRDGSEVIYSIADPKEKVGTILRLNDLHIRVDGQIYKVGKVPPIASNEAQVYTLTCKTRTVRPTGGFDNAR